MPAPARSDSTRMARRFSGKEGQIFQIIANRGWIQNRVFGLEGSIWQIDQPVALPLGQGFGGDNINRIIVEDPTNSHDHLPGAQEDDYPG